MSSKEPRTLIAQMLAVLDRIAQGEDANTVIEETGITATLCSARSSNVDGEHRWQDLCNAQGWNEEIQVIHLEGFIREQGLFGPLADYAADCAAEEASGEGNEPEDHGSLRINVRGISGVVHDPEDADVQGVYLVRFGPELRHLPQAALAALALNCFHDWIAIAVLDDFEISVIDCDDAVLVEDESWRRRSASALVEKISDHPLPIEGATAG